MVRREHPARTREASLDFISDEQDTVFLTEFRQRPHVSLRRHDETTFAQYQFHDHASDLLGVNVRVEELVHLFNHAALIELTPVRVWVRQPVHFGANGPNPNLYGITLLVSVIARSVRPANPCSKPITAGRFV